MRSGRYVEWGMTLSVAEADRRGLALLGELAGMAASGQLAGTADKGKRRL